MPARHPLGPGDVPEDSPYRRPPVDEEDVGPESPLAETLREPPLVSRPLPPADAGEEALSGLGASLLAVALFGPLIATAVCLENLSRRSPLRSWSLFLLAIAASGLVVLLVDGLGRRRSWARRGLQVIVCLPLLLVGATWVRGLLPTVGLLIALPLARLAWTQVRLTSRPEVLAYFRHPADPRRQDEVWPWWVWMAGFLILVVSLHAAQVLVRRATGAALLAGRVGELAALGGSIVGAALIVAALALRRGWQTEARRERALDDPALRARVVALRQAGCTLRQIAHHLHAEGLAPGVRWRARDLRQVLRRRR